MQWAIQCFVLLCVATSSVASCSGNTEACLIEHLFTNYSNEARPKLNHSEAINLNVSYFLRSMSKISAEEEMMETVGFWTVLWYDELLTWDPDDYESLSSLHLPANKVWLPDLYVENSVDGYYDDTFKKDFLVTLSSDGSMVWEFGGTFRTRCQINMLHYPYDTQTCALTLGLWMYTNDKVDITVQDPHEDEDEFETSLWKYIKVDYKKYYSYQYYAVAKYNYTFKRKPLYYAVNIVLPLIFLLVISLGTFWLPSECGEKASLGITVLLAGSVFQLIIAENMPISSDVTPNIIKLVITMMTVSVMALVSAMLSMYCCFKAPNVRVPRLLRLVAFNVLAKVFFLRKDVPDEPECFEQEKGAQNEDIVVEEKERPKSVGKLFKETELHEIRDELKFLKSVVVAQEKSNFIAEEWKCLGKVIDRFLFWICLAGFLIAVIAFYG